ncbi:MAG TPA: hypothetical protein DIS81_11475 [Psychrobacter sp.]|nr:hypothetical protein [Psychrobacter sp.]
MYKKLADLNFEKLEKRAPEALQAQTVTAVVLALGSNYHAETYLPIVREHLAALGEMQLSSAFQNPDFTATLELPKPDYTNQCVYLSLKSSTTLQQLQQVLKQFECDCHRQRSTKRSLPIKKVTMDIDILLVNVCLSKNSLSINEEFKWVVMSDRYPFKAHEKTGIKELIATGFLGS